jgi:transcriptional regulator with XRE-family HTH domain
MDSANEFGRRLREIRSWRQLSVRATAELSGLSYSYLAKIERGEKPVNNRQVLEALANTLRVAPTEFTGAPYAPSSPVDSDAHASLRQVELALSSLDLGVDPGIQAAPWPLLAEKVEHLNTVLRIEADYASQGELVPDLLAHLHAAYCQQPQHRRAILVGLIHVLHSAAVLTKNLGVRGFPVVASRQAEACAQELDTPEWLGFSAWLRGHSTGSQGRQQQYAMSIRAIDQMAGHLDEPNVLQAAGMLHLNAALASAARADADAAEMHLDEAADLAARLPDERENFGFLHFGPDNVGVWRVSLATELGAGPKVAELARGVRPETLPAKARQGMFWGDLGRALVTDRRTREQGLAALAKAERIAPQRIRNNVFVREAVAHLLRQARRDEGGRELRGLAYRMGVTPTG